MTSKSYRKSFFAALTFFVIVFFTSQAQARHFRSFTGHGFSRFHHRSGGYRYHRLSYGRVLQCVAFAKQASEVVLHGNARDWWHNAAGVYARGSAPETGSVLNFKGIRRMPLGHVAVVRYVSDSRTIYIDQSHWASNGISRNVRVVDVSPNNDWSAVRVALNSDGGRLGSIYPTFGFIYPRSDDRNSAPHIMVARSTHHSSFRHHGIILQGSSTSEVADAPDNAFPIDAPNRSIR